MGDDDVTPHCQQCAGQTEFVMEMRPGPDPLAVVRIFHCAACHHHTWEDIPAAPRLNRFEKVVR